MTRKAALILVLLALIVAISALIGPGSPLTVVEAQPSQVAQIVPQQISGLGAAVRIVTDSDGVPHIFAQTDHDGYLVLGYLHARDRLFQMDTSRRLFSGTLSELLGQSALPSDVQLRALGHDIGQQRQWVFEGNVEVVPGSEIQLTRVTKTINNQGLHAFESTGRDLSTP